MSDVTGAYSAQTNDEERRDLGKDVDPEDAGSDDNDEDDPEIRAELENAKEHGAVLPKNLPIREKLRMLRKLQNEPSKQVNGVVQVPRCNKNQRKSRTGVRGAPKKGALLAEGHGGKWTWGAANKIYDESELGVDSDDPNYDADVQPAKNVRYETITLEIDENIFERYAEPILLEFYENDDVTDAVESLRELNLTGDARTGVVRLAVTLSMDHKASTRELTSQLLAELKIGKVLSASNVEAGFKSLLVTDLPDLAIDYPHAAEYVGNFMARAIADEILSPKFLTDDDPAYNNCKLAKEALNQAIIMTQQKHRLDTIWGVGGGNRPVRFLVTKIKQLLDEYLLSGDVQEASRCLLELEVPHFHHEVVFQAGVATIESMHERTANMLAALLNHFYSSSVISADALTTGFDRLFDALPDLSLDVPPAYALCERWVTICNKLNFLPESIIRKMPQKSRKRFVSEGGCGAMKAFNVAHPLI